MNLASVGDAARLRRLEAVAASGWPAILTVAFGGFSAGFFAWYAFMTHAQHSPAALEATLFVGVTAGPIAALALWEAYARYFARRTDLSYRSALQWDVASWATLALLWIVLAAPAGISSIGRATALSVGLFALVKLLVAARFNATVRDVLVTFVVTRIPIIIIAELATIIIGQRAGDAFFAASSNPLARRVGPLGCRALHRHRNVNGYSGTEPAFFPLYPLS